MSTDIGNHIHIAAPPSHSPPQQTQPDLRHVASTRSRSHKRTSQRHTTSEARSPGLIPSSSSVYPSSSTNYTYHNNPVFPPRHYSSLAISTNYYNYVVPPGHYSSPSANPQYSVASPLPPSSYIHRIPLARRLTEHPEQFVPFVLDSGAEIPTRHQDPEAGDQVAVTPAASSFNEHAARSIGFTSYIGPSRSQPQSLHRDLPSDPRLWKRYLCYVFNIQCTDVIDFTGHIDRTEFIAAGGSGEVWGASWKGFNKNRLLGTPKALPMVVVKLIRLPPIKDPVSKDKRYKRMKRELLLWSKLNHLHILPLIGIALIEGDANLPVFISPWMKNGNIMEYLQRNPSLPASKFVKEVIEGLHYLHTFDPVIIHGDLKGANVLINHRKEACLCDFGSSRFVVDNTLWRTTATHANGTLRWMAPELIEGDMITPTMATDIYAFGMTCFEILSRGSPFASVNDFAVMKKVTDGQRPAKIESCHSDEIWTIITRCWAHKPEDRPSTEETLKLVLQHDILAT